MPEKTHDSSLDNERCLTACLPVVRDPQSDLMLTDQGLPAWPVRSDAEWESLQCTARVFGCELRSTPAVAGADTDRGHLVLGLGEEVRQLAELYAHLTRRRYQVVDDISQIPKNANIEVVVALQARIDDTLMSCLYDAQDAELAPGIITGVDVEACRVNALTRSAASALCGATHSAPDCVQISAGEHVQHEAWTESNSEELDSRIRALLAAEASVLMVTCHADRIDASLSPESTLCAMTDGIPSGDLATAPRCALTKYCHRQLMTIDEAREQKLLLSPRRIRSRVFVFNTCWGFASTRTGIGVDWCLVKQLLENPAIGAMLAPWFLASTNSMMITRLAELLLQGECIGNALATAMRSEDWRRVGLRMCLLGDPRTVVPRGSLSEQLNPEPEATAAAPEQPDTGALVQAGFNTAMMMQAITRTGATEHSARPNYIGRATQALQTSLAYAQGGYCGRAVEADQESLGDAMRSALLDFFFCRGGELDSIWNGLVESVEYDPDPAMCFACGRPTAMRSLHNLRIPLTSTRELRNCPRCGIVYDAPSTTECSYHLDWEQGEIHLNGAPSCINSAAGIILKSQHPGEHLFDPWPRDDRGRLQPSAKIPSKWPIGPVKMTVAVLWDASFLLMHRHIEERKEIERHMRNGTATEPLKQGSPPPGGTHRTHGQP